MHTYNVEYCLGFNYQFFINFIWDLFVYLIDTCEKTDQISKYEKFFSKPPEDDVYFRVSSNSDATEPMNLLNRTSSNKNHSIIYLPQLCQYNALHFGSNCVPQNSFMVNDYNLDNSDENSYSV